MSIYDSRNGNRKPADLVTDLRVDTEDKGFEPSRRANGLTHFECAPFDHLGNPPGCCSIRAAAFYIIRALPSIWQAKSALRISFPAFPAGGWRNICEIRSKKLLCTSPLRWLLQKSVLQRFEDRILRYPIKKNYLSHINLTNNCHLRTTLLYL